MRILMLILAISLNSALRGQTTYDRIPHCLDSIFISNSFSRCSDGIVDYWSIYFPCAPDSVRVTIYNRWGEIVFESVDIQFRWYGHDSRGNVQLPTGTYFFELHYAYLGDQKKRTGPVHFNC